MRGEIVHDVVQGFCRGKLMHVPFEDLQERFDGVVRLTFECHFAAFVFEEGENVQRAVADVFELLKALLSDVGKQIGGQAFENLDTGTFIEEEQVRRRVEIQSEQMFHLRKEVGVSDVEEVGRQVGLELVVLQNALDSGFAGPQAKSVRILFERRCGPTQGPSSTICQRLCLTVERGDSYHRLLVECRAAPRTAAVAKPRIAVTSRQPSLHGLRRALQLDGNEVDLLPSGKQGNHRFTTDDLECHWD